MGDYARYFDPLDGNALAIEMLNQLQEKEGKTFKNSSIFNINNSLTALEKIFSKAAVISKNWI